MKPRFVTGGRPERILAVGMLSLHECARAKHDKLLALRAYKAAEDAQLEAQEELPPLKIAK
jgi:hypothetical protein